MSLASVVFVGEICSKLAERSAGDQWVCRESRPRWAQGSEGSIAARVTGALRHVRKGLFLRRFGDSRQRRLFLRLHACKHYTGDGATRELADGVVVPVQAMGRKIAPRRGSSMCTASRQAFWKT